MALQALMHRRTVRQYETDYVIPKEHLNKIVDATLWSPTAVNNQDIDLLVVTNQDVLTKVANASMATWNNTNMLKSFNGRKQQFGVKNVVTCDAPCVIFLVKNERADPLFTGIDNGILCMAIMVAAQEFGYESMCIGSLLWGKPNDVEEVLGIKKDSLLMAVAFGKPKPNLLLPPKEIIAKATYIE